MTKPTTTLTLLFAVVTISVVPSFVNAQMETVPDWVKNTAGWWSEGKVSTTEFLDGIEYLIEKGIITVPGYIQEADAQETDQESFDELWNTLDSIHQHIEEIQLNLPLKETNEDEDPFKTYAKEIESGEINSGKSKEVILSCDDGDRLLTGGYYHEEGAGALDFYKNTIDPKIPNVWVVSAYNTQQLTYNTQQSTSSFKAQILCLDFEPKHNP